MTSLLGSDVLGFKFGVLFCYISTLPILSSQAFISCGLLVAGVCQRFFECFEFLISGAWGELGI